MRSQDSRNLYRAVLLLALVGFAFAAGPIGASGSDLMKLLDDIAQAALKGMFYAAYAPMKLASDFFASEGVCTDKVGSPTTVIAAFALAIIITLLLAVFRYLVRKLASQELQGVDPKAELTAGVYHAAESMIVLFFVLVAYSIFITPSQTYPYMEEAKSFTRNMTAHLVSQVVIMGIIGTMTYSIYNSFEVDWPLTASSQIYIPIAFGKTLQPIIDTYGILAQFIAVATGEWFAKYLILCFLGKYALTLLMPLALVFRSLKLTEGFGNGLLAFTLSLFFFYPILISINAAVFKAVTLDPSMYMLHMGSDFAKLFSPFIGLYILSTLLHGGGALLAGLGGVFKDTASVAAFIKLFSKLGITANALGSMMALVGSSTIKILLVMSIVGLTIYIVEWLVLLIGVFSFFFTILNIYLTIGLAYTISKALGTPLDFSALMRMI